MAKMRKSWREKLHDRKDLPKVVEITGSMSQRWGTGTMVKDFEKALVEI